MSHYKEELKAMNDIADILISVGADEDIARVLRWLNAYFADYCSSRTDTK